MKVQDIVKITEAGTVISITNHVDGELLAQARLGVHTQLAPYLNREVVYINTSADDDDFELVIK